MNFSPDMNNYSNFIEVVHKITRIPISDMVITFVDLEDEKLEIKDNLDFEYFNKVTEGRKFKAVFVEVRGFEVESQPDEQVSQILEQVMNTYDENVTQGKNLFSARSDNEQIGLTTFDKAGHSVSTIETSIPLEKINTELRTSGRLPGLRGFDEFNCHIGGAFMSKPLPPAHESQQLPLETINPETRPFKQLPFYRGLGEFIDHFDEALTFKQDVIKVIRHSGVRCDVCNQNNITGKRYKCLVCINFDICENCENENAHQEHPMVRCNQVECNKSLNKLNKKFRKYKKRAEKKIQKGEDHFNLSDNLRFKKDKIKTFIKKSIVPTFKKLFKRFEEETIKVEKVPNPLINKLSINKNGIETNDCELDKQRNEKKEILRFMYVDAEEEVVDILVKRFDGLNLTEFLEELEKNNRILDGF